MIGSEDHPLLQAEALTKWYGAQIGCRDISFELYPGEVMAVVGESGSGKTTLLQLLSAQLRPSAGHVAYRMRDGVMRDLASLGEAERRFLFRTDWGYVHQEPALGLRMAVSAGANVGERLMVVGWNHYGRIRDTARDWLDRVEIARERIDDAPAISSPIRASSSWTSRLAASMCRFRRASWTSFADWWRNCGLLPSSSPTI